MVRTLDFRSSNRGSIPRSRMKGSSVTVDNTVDFDSTTEGSTPSSPVMPSGLMVRRRIVNPMSLGSIPRGAVRTF